MSLNVYLYGPPETVKCVCQECGHEHTREKSECYYAANVTHNLNRMADEAGIYKALWRPEEIGITTAGQLIDLLERGIYFLVSDPDRFKLLEPSNGWGTYESFVPWLRSYLEACKLWHQAKVKVSR